MACRCEETVGHSNSRKPFCPPGGTVNDLFFRCPDCDQAWAQTNTHFHLWDKRSYKALQRDQEAVAAYYRDPAYYDDHPWEL